VAQANGSDAAKALYYRLENVTGTAEDGCDPFDRDAGVRSLLRRRAND